MKKDYELALITGASSGIGRELAKLIAQKGIPLLLTARNTDKLKEIQHTLSHLTKVEIFPCDLSSSINRQKILKIISQKSPNLIINSAGFGYYGNILSYTLEEQMQVLQTNAQALAEISIEGARTLIKMNKKGTILNISSMAGFYSFPTLAIYSAAKSFVTLFSLGFDAEVSPYGIRILTSCPGKVNTLFRDKAAHGYPQAPPSQSIPVEKAARLLFKQIAKEKAFQILDNRYKFFYFFSYLIPRPLMQKILRRSIDNCYIKKEITL